MTAQGGRPDLHSSWADRQARKAAVEAWVEKQGYLCPGWDRPPHPATDLTADHPHAVAAGGEASTTYAVLCRSCNGKKGKSTHIPVRVPSVRSRNWLPGDAQ